MTDSDGPAADSAARPGVSRRTLGVAALGAAVSGAAIGVGADRALRGDTPAARAADPALPAQVSRSVTPYGRHQAGTAEPVVAPSYLRLVVADLTATEGVPAAARAVVADLGRVIAPMALGTHPQLAGLAPGRLTVSVAVGPRIVAAVDSRLPGATPLPEFVSDRTIPANRRGGDLAIQIAADDPVLVAMAATILTASLGRRARIRWAQDGFRGPAVGSAARNVVGFVDGISVPHGAGELDEQVWLSSPAAVAGSTILAVRRFRIDVTGFTAQSLAAQEAAVGRRRGSSAPLSGGSIDSDPDLGAKTPDGRYRVPVMAHVRRAHPLTVGAGLMLRRSYSIAGDPGDVRPGLLFLSYQRDLRTFTATQQRLDDGDALLRFAVADATATFLVLAGFDARTELGAALFG